MSFSSMPLGRPSCMLGYLSWMGMSGLPGTWIAPSETETCERRALGPSKGAGLPLEST